MCSPPARLGVFYGREIGLGRQGEETLYAGVDFNPQFLDELMLRSLRGIDWKR
jgi:hypothetical protein